MSDVATKTIKAAQSGDAQALENLVRAVQDQVHRLALRMLADPVAAQDAAQEILIRIVTKLSTFKGEARFETWVHRVATNALLTTRKVIAADPGLSFEMFSDDLLSGLADDAAQAPEDHVMLNELRLRCTMAMLLCLDREHRAAYVLGEVLEFEQGEAAQILEITPQNFRKRLSRARQSVQAFTAKTCGLAASSAPCTCRKRLPAALAMGRLAGAPIVDAPAFADVKAEAERTAAHLVAAKLQRATGPLAAPGDQARAVLRLVTPPEP